MISKERERRCDSESEKVSKVQGCLAIGMQRCKSPTNIQEEETNTGMFPRIYRISGALDGRIHIQQHNSLNLIMGLSMLSQRRKGEEWVKCEDLLIRPHSQKQKVRKQAGLKVEVCLHSAATAPRHTQEVAIDIV